MPRISPFMLALGVGLLSGIAFAPEEKAPTPSVTLRELEPAVDHNHCTTRQFQHMTFQHQGVWFVFYSDGKDFRYQTSADGGQTWRRRHLRFGPNRSSPAALKAAASARASRNGSLSRRTVYSFKNILSNHRSSVYGEP